MMLPSILDSTVSLKKSSFKEQLQFLSDNGKILLSQYVAIFDNPQKIKKWYCKLEITGKSGVSTEVTSKYCVDIEDAVADCITKLTDYLNTFK